MLLNSKQQNPLTYGGRSILINEDYLNAMHLFTWVPVGEGYVKDCIEAHPEMSDEEIARTIENGIRKEIIDLSSEAVWDEMYGKAKTAQ